MTDPVEVVVHAMAEAQALIVDYSERRGRGRSLQATINGLRAVLEDPAVVTAMEALGHAPIRTLAALRVIDGGVSNSND